MDRLSNVVWVSFINMCFLSASRGLILFRLHNVTTDYETAVEECVSSGGTLPLVDKVEVDSFLAKVLKTKDIRSTWLMMKRRDTDWTWTKEETAAMDQGCLRVYGDDGSTSNDLPANPHNEFRDCLQVCKASDDKYARTAWDAVRGTHVCKCSDWIEGRPARINNCPVECDAGLCGGDEMYERVFITTVADNSIPWMNDMVNWGDCAAASYTEGENPGDLKLQIHSEVCQAWKNFICAVPAGTLSCDAPIGRVCIVPSGVESDWVGARQHCKREGGEIASLDILNEDLHHWIFPKRTGSFWIGLAAENWEWDTEPELPMDFTNWNHGQLMTAPEDCAVMELNGKWTKGSCDEQHQVICQLHAASAAPSRIYQPTTISSRGSVRPSVVPSVKVDQSSQNPGDATTSIPNPRLQAVQSADSLPVGIIAGVCGGVAVIIIVSGVVAVIILRRRNHKRLEEEKEPSETIHGATNPMYDYDKPETSTEDVSSLKPCEYIPHVVDINVEKNSIAYKKDLGSDNEDETEKKKDKKHFGTDA